MNETKSGLARTITESTTFKVLVIGLLILILLIPAGMVRSLIRERELRLNAVVGEISAKWGGQQVLTGPVLSLPYERTFKGPDGKAVTETVCAHILPDELNITGEVTPEIRYRGMYEAVLYNARLTLSGLFPAPDFRALGISPRDVRWDRAFVSVGIPDMKGLKDNVTIRLNKTDGMMNPGVPSSDVLSSGIHAPAVGAARDAALSFELNLNLNGSQWLAFAPVGKTTRVKLASSWQTPSFDGAFLPEERTVGAKGFTARWNVLHLNRNYPQCWTGAQQNIGESAFGVRLCIPVDAYQKSTRTVKYAILFILFTFMAFFFSESMNCIRIHPLQYLLIGLALIVFYTLLISISEHLTFGSGYLISSAATILLITGYARGILGKGRLSAVVGCILALLYGYLYILLQLEDYALLLGSVGLFVILAVVMYLTRRLNWYAIGPTRQPPPIQ